MSFILTGPGRNKIIFNTGKGLKSCLLNRDSIRWELVVFPHLEKVKTPVGIWSVGFNITMHLTVP